MKIKSKLKIISVSQIFAILITFYTGFIWLPWIGAMSRKEAIEKYNITVPETWDSVTMDHGKLSHWKRGTIIDNPYGFLIYTMIFWGSGIYVILSMVYSTNLKKNTRN